jgi:hypothetical protein
MKNPRIYFVYGLFRKYARKPFYIGKGHGDRPFVHVRDVKLGKFTPSYKNHIIRKELELYGKLRGRYFATELTEKEAFSLEKKLIAEYGRHDLGTGCLANLTEGGEGSSGYIYTEKDKQKLRNGHRRYWSNPEAREKASAYIKKRYEDPKEREKVNAPRNALFTPGSEASRRRGEAISRAKSTPEFKAKLSEMLKKRWADPEYRAKVLASVAEAQKRPEYSQALSEKSKARWADPEYKARVSEKIRKARQIQTPEERKAAALSSWKTRRGE